MKDFSCYSNTALSEQRNFVHVQEESWSDVSSGDMHVNDVKLSPVFPHQRSGDTFQSCSAISYVDTCNYQLFYDDFSCDNNNQRQSYSNLCSHHCHMGSLAYSGCKDKNYDDMSYNLSGNSLSLDLNDVLLDQKSYRPLPEAIDHNNAIGNYNNYKSLEENFEIANNSPRALLSVPTDRKQVMLDNKKETVVPDFNFSTGMHELLQKQHSSCNTTASSSFNQLKGQHGYLSLCNKRNILATFNDTKHRQKILDKKIGFVSVPITRTLSWEQANKIIATSMLQWAVKAHKLVVHTKVDNYKDDRIIVPSD